MEYQEEDGSASYKKTKSGNIWPEFKREVWRLLVHGR
jgi:hypothetical protein